MNNSVSGKLIVEQRLPVLVKARRAFFQAMLAGYTDDNQEGKGPHLEPELFSTDTETKITTQVGDFSVVDEWTKSPSDKSSGSTTIFCWGIPVWRMSYDGFNKKKAINYLKKALAMAYKKGKFIAGRGPRRVCFRGQKYDYIYVNEKSSGGRQTFRWFSGNETIVRVRRSDNHQVVVGTHRFQGMALI